MTNRNQFLGKKTAIIMMVILVVLSVLLLSGCSSQSAPKVKRVGVLNGLVGTEFLVDSLKAELTELGYVEGENIEYDVEVFPFDVKAFQNTLQRFVDEEVDVIVVFSTEALFEAQAITEGTDIPVVFGIALIDGQGIVDSLREPGGNITGVRYPSEIALNRYEILHQLLPDIQTILIPHQSGVRTIPSQIEAIKSASNADGVTLIEMPVNTATAAELETELQALAEKDVMDVDAILLLSEPLFVGPETFPVLAKFAAAHDLPIGGALLFGEETQSMFGIDIDLTAPPIDMAPLVDKILQGVPVGTIPIVSSEPSLTLNMIQLENMGLEPPEELLIMADTLFRQEDYEAYLQFLADLAAGAGGDDAASPETEGQ
jgi:putative ABC transport system substrate-binding protein